MILRSVIYVFVFFVFSGNALGQLFRTSFKISCDQPDSICLEIEKSIVEKLRIVTGEEAISRKDSNVLYFRVNEKLDSSYVQHLINLNGGLQFGFIRSIYSMAPELSVAFSRLKEEAREVDSLERIDRLLKYRVNRFLEEALGSALMCKEEDYDRILEILARESVHEFFEKICWYSGLPHKISELGPGNPFFLPSERNENFKVIYPIHKTTDNCSLSSIKPSSISLKEYKSGVLLSLGLSEEQMVEISQKAAENSNMKLCLLIGNEVFAVGDPISTTKNHIELLLAYEEKWKIPFLIQHLNSEIMENGFNIYSYQSR